MSNQNAVAMGLFLGVIATVLIGLVLIPSPEEILEKYGCEIVPIEIKLRRLEILMQGFEAKLIGIEATLDHMREER
jgi:hypothetical protein